MKSGRTRIYITVKTYPTISEKYAELVCTAGLLEDGSWIRIYPMPFRLLNDDQKYPKYTWIEADITKNTSDFRPESYRPDLQSIKVEDRPKSPDWDERRRIILQNGTVHTNLQQIIDKAKSKERMSLATFKPAEILDFVVEKDSRDWDSQKLASLQLQASQLSIFQTEDQIREEFRVVQKIPYKFSYKFVDDSGKKSQLMIEDWEIGMLYLNCLKHYGDETVAVKKVREKYLEQFAKRDVYFFLGTTLKNHVVSRNPFLIIGVFCPPKLVETDQLSLF